WQAAILDPEESRALDLLDRARDALDRQKAEAHLSEADRSLRAGNLSEASQQIEQALQLDPQSARAAGLRTALAEAFELKRKEEEKQRAISVALDAARKSLAEQSWDSAVRAAGEVLVHDPVNLEARDISGRARAAIEERHAKEEL